MLSGSDNFMTDLTTDQFAIWAYGGGTNEPQRHNPLQQGRSASAINLQFKSQVILVIVSFNIFRVHLKASQKIFVSFFRKYAILIGVSLASKVLN